MKAILLSLALALAINLSAPAASVPDAPANLDGYDAHQGKTFHFMVRGTAEGKAWGTDVYTMDSNLGVAAVHAGLVKPGEKKEVVILMLPGQASYRGSSRHGVATSDYPEYHASYRFLKPAEAEADLTDGKHPLTTPGNLLAFKPRVGETLLFKVTGTTEGSLWGTDVYTGDSTLALAAVHAGMVKPGETANLRVTLLPGREQYKGSENNGVTSGDYESYDLSFRFEPNATVDATATGEASKSQPADKGKPKQP